MNVVSGEATFQLLSPQLWMLTFGLGQGKLFLKPCVLLKVRHLVLNSASRLLQVLSGFFLLCSPFLWCSFTSLGIFYTLSLPIPVGVPLQRLTISLNVFEGLHC